MSSAVRRISTNFDNYKVIEPNDYVAREVNKRFTWTTSAKNSQSGTKISTSKVAASNKGATNSKR